MKDKKVLFGIIASLVFTGVFILIYIGLSSVYSFKDENGYYSKNTIPARAEFHFAAITPNVDDYFWNAVKAGASQAARDFNAAVEVETSNFANPEEQVRCIDIAIASKLDGIILNAVNDKSVTPFIDKAVQAGIPVVTIDADAKDSKRNSFVGTNSFEMGVKAGKMLAEATGGKANVAIIINSYIGNNENVSENLKVLGFKDAVKGFPDIKVSLVEPSNAGVFSAEEVTQKILQQDSKINAIFCTSTKDTMGAAQVVVDLNRVGEISIIGYGDSTDILRYIERKVIYGSVVSDPVKIGYESVKILVELKKNNNASIFVDTGLYTINSSNLDEYKKQIEKRKGHAIQK